MNKFFKDISSCIFYGIYIYYFVCNDKQYYSRIFLKTDFVSLFCRCLFILLVSVIVDWLLSFIDFSKYIYHFIAEMIILYPITIGVAFIGKWFAFSAINITWYSCVYILIMIAIHCYFLSYFPKDKLMK